MSVTAEQLGFEALLNETDAVNRSRKIERETAHLPGTMSEALPFYRVLLKQHHAVMLAANIDEAMRLRKEAHNLVLRLNGGNKGILAEPDSPGNVLDRESAASADATPLWGQSGSFVIEAADMKARIELEGIFGIAASSFYWPGFSAHAVEFDRPFLSATGYRSFLGIHAEPVPGITPEEFTRRVVEAYVTRELKGALVPIAEKYRNRDRR
ncbi:MAG: hypothetical protein KZQ94_01095 [Candidatus Thiodiazotropha sp. (ex Troendleina suluensis)]|nr:hypothetical protein [Candidatus Thiodiazotropha sp. (ex Troendleina suluensis)]